MVRGLPYDLTADDWSFGVLLFFMLTKTFPFDDANSVEKLEDSIIADWVDLQPVLDLGYSDTCVDLLSKLLDKNPAKRITASRALK